MEQASVNDHYGFYQTPAKVIKQERSDPTTTDDNAASFNTALKDNAHDEEHKMAADYLEYEKY